MYLGFLCSVSEQSKSRLFWRMVQALTGTTRILLCSVYLMFRMLPLSSLLEISSPFLALGVHWELKYDMTESPLMKGLIIYMNRK